MGLGIKQAPAEGVPDALELLGFGCQPSGGLTKEDEREIQLAGQIIRDGDRGSRGFRYKAAIGPSRTELDREATSIGLAPAPQDFLTVTGREGPELEQLLLTGVLG